MQLHLRDLGRPLVEAWQEAFRGVPDVRISQGDIFSDAPGIVEAGAPIDVRADAIVSPADSFGFMDGGIDAVYTLQTPRMRTSRFAPRCSRWRTTTAEPRAPSNPYCAPVSRPRSVECPWDGARVRCELHGTRSSAKVSPFRAPSV